MHAVEFLALIKLHAVHKCVVELLCFEHCVGEFGILLYWVGLTLFIFYHCLKEIYLIITFFIFGHLLGHSAECLAFTVCPFRVTVYEIDYFVTFVIVRLLAGEYRKTFHYNLLIMFIKFMSNLPYNYT